MHTQTRTRITCGLAAAGGGVVLSRCVRAGLDTHWVFLGSIAVFGLAHGACDLWLPGWVRGQPMNHRFIGVFCLVYAGLAGGVLLFWEWQATLATAGFLLLTAWHWGSADAALAERETRHPAVLAWGRGVMVLAAPAAFHPVAVGRVLGALDPHFFGCLTAEPLQISAGILSVAAVLVQSVALPPGRRDGFRVRGYPLETLFLLGLFATFDPLISTAMYFVWFHAWRHILRLCRWQSPDEPGTATRLLRFHAAAWPCSAGALVMLWWVARRWPGDLLHAYLVLLSAVTLPHALLVGWLDRVERARTAAGTMPRGNVANPPATARYEAQPSGG